MKKSYLWLVGILVLVVAGTLYALNLPKNDADVQSTNPASNTPSQSVSDKSSTPRLIIGDPTAKLAITEYSDPQCPICKRFFDQTESQLISEYIDTKKVYLEVKVETHIGDGSQLAGEAWYCAADQGKFKDYHDKTFQQQGRQAFNSSNLKAFAGQVGLDQANFNSCLDSGKYTAIVKQSHAEATSKISSTPTFFIGSQKIVGAQPYSVFKTVIDSQK